MTKGIISLSFEVRITTQWALTTTLSNLYDTTATEVLLAAFSSTGLTKKLKAHWAVK